MTCISTSTGLLRRWLSPAIASLYWTARSAEPRSGSARPPDDCDGAWLPDAGPITVEIDQTDRKADGPQARAWSVRRRRRQHNVTIATLPCSASCSLRGSGPASSQPRNTQPSPPTPAATTPGSASGLLAATPSVGNLAASSIAVLIWTAASRRGLRLPHRLDGGRDRSSRHHTARTCHSPTVKLTTRPVGVSPSSHGIRKTSADR